MTMTDQQIEWSAEPTYKPGGQHVGNDNTVIIATHRETGITVRIPPMHRASQYKRRVAASEAIEWVLSSCGWRP